MFDLRQFAAITPEWYLRLKYYDELGSTNDEARLLAESGAEHGTVVLADHQKRGRGRRGAIWESSPGDGLLFSLVLKPGFPQPEWSRIALATGLGIATALREKWNIAAEVKWPNDVYLHGKKCAGILAEAYGGFVVVGVGINVMASPDDPACIAMAEVMGQEVSREKVLAVLLDAILSEADACSRNFSSQLSRLREMCYLTGKQVTFTSNNASHTGKVVGIGDGGELLVEKGGVTTSFIQAETIRVPDREGRGGCPRD